MMTVLKLGGSMCMHMCIYSISVVCSISRGEVFFPSQFRLLRKFGFLHDIYIYIFSLFWNEAGLAAK